MRQDAESFHAAQSRVLEQIAKGDRLSDILAAIVELIEAQADDMLCSILLYDDATQTLRHGAALHLPAAFMKMVDGQSIGPTAGSCGAAAALRERVVIEDIATHPNWKPYRELALAHHLCACWSTPIFSSERVLLGTFAMYYRERRKPKRDEIVWVEAATHLASVAIVHDRDATSLRRDEARARRQTRLYDVASSINEVIVKLRTETEICRVVCQLAVDKRLALSAWVGVYVESEQRVDPIARAGGALGHVGDTPAQSAGALQAAALRAAQDGMAVTCNDVELTPIAAPVSQPRKGGEPSIRSCAAFPLRLLANKRGVFALSSEAADAFGAEEIKVLSSLTEHITFAIESLHNARERELLLSVLEERTGQLERTERRLSLLDQLGEQLLLAETPEDVLPLALRMLGLHLRVNRCVYGLFDPSGDRCTIPADYTDGTFSIAGEYRISNFGPAIAEILRRSGPLVVRDVRAELPHEEASALERLDMRAFICCTLTRQGSVRALMAVHSSLPREWSAEEIGTVQTFVERCWTTIEQRSAEAKLRASESLLRLASEAAHMGGFSLSIPDGEITWSDEVCRIHEVPAGTAPSREQAEQAYAPEYRELIKRKFVACALDGVPFDVDAQLITARGRTVWVRVSGRAERDAQDRIIHVRGALQDVSERRALEEQLRQSQKMEAVGQLAGGVAHDFNNIMSVILSCAHFLATDLDDDDPRQAEIEQICKAAEGAGELTRKLLSFSRKQMLSPRAVDLNQIVGGLERMLRRLLGDRIELAFVTEAALGKTLADRGEIEQVIMNLVVNARDALSDPSVLARGARFDGKLTIETSNAQLDHAYAEVHPGVQPGPYVLLTVRDTGVGMDEITRARIFEPFFTTKETGKGTGLGLTTVYGIVAQTGGHIAVSSAKGRGTTFRIYLPRVERELEHVTSDSRPPPLSPGGETILVVEDDDQVRAVVRAMLARAKYEVLLARGGQEALLLCQEHPSTIHLMLTDTVMPRMGGRELAEFARPLRPGMKILFMSGYTDDHALPRDAAQDGGAFLPKPITPETLLHKVRQLLDRK